MKECYCNIALPVPLRTTFTYFVPEPLRERVQPGSRVLVPFRKKSLVGVGGQATRQGRAHGFRGQRGRIPRKAAREEARADLDSAQQARDSTASVRAAATSRLHRSSRNGRGPKAEDPTGGGVERQGRGYAKAWG